MAEQRPQIIYNRSTPVAAVVSATDYAAFMELREGTRRSLKDAVREMVEVADDERYVLPAESRTERPNPLDAPRKEGGPTRRRRARR